MLEAAGDFTVEADPRKVYPRELDKEVPMYRGRVRYQTSEPKFAKKNDVLKYVGDMIPKLKTRQSKSSGQAAVAEQQSQQSGKSKKKGKK